MRKISLLLLSTILILFLFNTCNTSDDEGVVINGTITAEQTGQPIGNALVQISSPGQFSNTFTRSDSSGNYSLGTIEIEEVTDIGITVSVPNYVEQTRTIRVTPDDEITGFNFSMVAEGDDDDDNGGPGIPSGPEGGAASIELVSLSNETINIVATGGITSSTFAFEVQDSSGNSVTASNAVDVLFSIVSGPGGEESIYPEVVTTNAQGLAVATLRSGNRAGVVKIEARIERTVEKTQNTLAKIQQSRSRMSAAELASRKGGKFRASLPQKEKTPLGKANQDPIKAQQNEIVITSEPVAVTIHGGFPDSTRFNILSEFSNYEFTQNLQIPVSVSIGDEFTNPVKPGTAVYFDVTDGEGIIDGSAEGHTDAEGTASVNFKPGGTGNAEISATTVDKDDNQIKKALPLLLTSSSANINAPDEIQIDAGGNEDIQFTVTDRNGNPMAPGTTVEVEIDTALVLSGATSVTLADNVQGGNNITSFKFNVQATDDFLGSANIIITITSPSGVTSTEFIALRSSGGGVPGEPEEPASLELLSISQESINIAESGGTTNADFTFQVKDAAGRNLDANSAVDVAFSIISNPGGATIIPETVRSNAQGRVTSNLNAGNTAGVVQIEAHVVGTDIRSKPVAVTIHGGFPDEDHFTLEPVTDTNIEGFDRNGVEATFKVRAGDQFSNPVKQGTAVYFSTTGGVIEGSGVGHTDATGYTEVTLFAGNPRPTNGIGEVRATTAGANGDSISITTPFIFSTSKADISVGLNELELAPGESQSVSYSVFDLNGNPMAAGTSIQVISGGNIQLSGTTSHTMTNELAPGNRITDFSFTASAPDGFSGSETITIVVTSPAGVVTSNQNLTIRSTGGGVSGPPTAPAALVLDDLQHNTINIKETGGIVNTAFTFVVQDSSGRALDSESPVEVEFEIMQGPGGDEGVLPTKATTNSSGRVTSNLFSGNIAGVVRLRAFITRDDGVTIQSTPVAITIHGGFPDADHFSLAPTTRNIEGYNINGNTTQLEVIVGDKFSNPVKPGTAVYFETTGGVIQGSDVDHTDDLGRASVTLQSGNPRGPDDDGKLTVTARTIDDNNQFIEETADVVFSTSAAIISTTDPMPFDTLAPGGGATFSYTVTDLFGNPMAAGTQINIKAGGGIEVTGSANFTLGDHLLPGPGATEFTFSIRDTDEESNDPADLTILIEVITPGGNVTTFDGIQGVRRKAPNNFDN